MGLERMASWLGWKGERTRHISCTLVYIMYYTYSVIHCTHMAAYYTCTVDLVQNSEQACIRVYAWACETDAEQCMEVKPTSAASV